MIAAADITKITNRWDRLVLAGFMGAGKSTVGGLLASRLKLPFIDSDHAIEQHSGRTIAQLFEECGEPQFRLLEARVIADLVTQKPLVIALGGGALENRGTRDLFLRADRTCVIHLEAPLATLLERCRDAAPTRPLLQDEHSLVRRHSERLEHYRKAHITLLTEGFTPGEVLEKLLLELSVFTASQAVCGEATTQ
jgi:shikimate kinase